MSKPDYAGVSEASKRYLEALRLGRPLSPAERSVFETREAALAGVRDLHAHRRGEFEAARKDPCFEIEYLLPAQHVFLSAEDQSYLRALHEDRMTPEQEARFRAFLTRHAAHVAAFERSLGAGPQPETKS